MGACMSSGGDSVTNRSNSALVISPKGDLRRYSSPVFVSDVLQLEIENAAASSFFVCNSDNLSYDEHIRALDSEDELDAGQIYFVLPISKLRDRLSASEMAALAVKASVALNSKANSKTITRSGSISRSKVNVNGSSQKRMKNKSSKISPFVVMETSKINVIVDEEEQNKRLVDQSRNYHNKQQQASSLGVSRSGSIRKLQRYSSRKARLAVRSFRLRLSTIYESESSHHSQRYY